MCIFVLCLIVLPLPPGKAPLAVQLNNNNKKTKDRSVDFDEISYSLHNFHYAHSL
jgi:hypothetical protein